MQKHARMFALLPANRRAHYEARASVQQHIKRQADLDSLLALEEAEAMRQTRIAQAAAVSAGMLTLSNCKFTDQDFEKMAAIWNTAKGFLPAKIQERRARWLSSATMPDLATRHKLQQVEAALPGEGEGHIGQWMATIIRLRWAFRGCALSSPHARQHIAFLLACQQPFFALFVRLEPMQLEVPLAGDARATTAYVQTRTDFLFHNTRTFISQQDLPGEEP